MSGGLDIVSRSSQHGAQKRQYIGIAFQAKYAPPAALCSFEFQIPTVKRPDCLLLRFMGVENLRKMGHRQHFAYDVRDIAEFQVSVLFAGASQDANNGANATTVY